MEGIAGPFAFSPTLIDKIIDKIANANHSDTEST